MQEEATLNLKWDSFSSQLTNSLDACYENKFFVDLSLVCKNGTILKCHKMVLANASSFFRRLLVRNDHPHPMIILHDIEADDLKTIISFMYCGEIQVVKSEVKRILKVAEILEVSGLKDIRSKILAPEINNASRECPKTPLNPENTPKIGDLKNLGKSNMDAETSTSSFQRRFPIATKSFWNFSARNNEAGKGIEAQAKNRANLTKKYENMGQQLPAGGSGRITANYQRAINHSGAESICKKRLRSDEPISWTKVLSEISKETAMPLKKLCVMDEVEITASKARTEEPVAKGSLYEPDARTLTESDPLDTSGIVVKQEIDTDFDNDDEYDSNVATEERDESTEGQITFAGPPLEVFKTVHCTSGVVTLAPKRVTLIDVLGRKDSSG